MTTSTFQKIGRGILSLNPDTRNKPNRTRWKFCLDSYLAPSVIVPNVKCRLTPAASDCFLIPSGTRTPTGLSSA